MAMSGTSSDYVSQYEGLTELQISTIKMIESECDTQVAMAFFQSEKASRIIEEKCDQTIQNKIDDYRTSNERP